MEVLSVCIGFVIGSLFTVVTLSVLAVIKTPLDWFAKIDHESGIWFSIRCWQFYSSSTVPPFFRGACWFLFERKTKANTKIINFMNKTIQAIPAGGGHVVDFIDPNYQKLKIYYRCNRCLSIQHDLLDEDAQGHFIVLCSKCSGLAIKLPVFHDSHAASAWTPRVYCKVSTPTGTFSA